MESRPIDETRLGLAVEALGFDWLYHAQTGSTNADALAHFDQYGREVVAFAEQQTAGRGRRGREWLSPFARNLYCTLGLRRDIPAASQGLLSIVTGIALCRALRSMTSLPIELKWPNDLMLGGVKFGGILIESRPQSAGGFFFAIGFGLNLMMHAGELAGLDRPATSLGLHLDAPPDRDAILLAVIEAVATAIREFDVDGVELLCWASASLGWGGAVSALRSASIRSMAAFASTSN